MMTSKQFFVGTYRKKSSTVNTIVWSVHTLFSTNVGVNLCCAQRMNLTDFLHTVSSIVQIHLGEKLAKWRVQT